jgi:P-type Cu+ transporter
VIGASAGKEAAMTAIDPVCGMDVEEEDAAATTEYDDTTYFFCSLSCQQEFDENPEAFLD